jgi:hypothetical protein
MSNRLISEVAAGEALVIYLEAVIGDYTTVTPTSAHIKPIPSPTMPVPGASVASVGALAIQAQTTSPGLNADGTAILPGWYLTLDEAQSASLVPGYYIADMAYTLAGNQFVTDPVVINIVNSVSLS